MFGEDVSDQWQRKKQTPEQKKAARMAKLDPANWKSAKDVYDERSAETAKKRKRDQEGDEDNQKPVSQQEQPNKKQKTKEQNAPHKPKPTEKLTERLESDQLQNKNLKKKMKKRAHKSEKNQQKRAQKEDRKIEKANVPPQSIEKTKSSKKESGKGKKQPVNTAREANKESSREAKRMKSATRSQLNPIDAEMPDQATADEDKEADDDEQAWSDAEEDLNEIERPDGDEHNAVGKSAVEDEDADEDEEMVDAISSATSSDGMPDILSPPQDSVASSVSSLVPSTQTRPAKNIQTFDKKTKTPEPAQPENATPTDAERQAARERLQEQISQFRSQRKADDKPVRSRAELLAQRRQKEQERKVAKKEQKKKEKEEEAKRQDEEMAKRFSPGGSGSLLASPRSPMIDDGGSNAFTFGRIAFDDGTQFDATTGSAAATKKHKGPADPATALKAAQAKQARIAGLDDQKKQSIEEKDMWLNAKKRAHGERVKDDTSLLKKALKRQEKQKQRSEKDWDARTEGVRASQEAKQKKRTENLQKREDEKGGKKTGSKKKVKRPGFEGSFRGRAGKSKKS